MSLVRALLVINAIALSSISVSSTDTQPQHALKVEQAVNALCERVPAMARDLLEPLLRGAPGDPSVMWLAGWARALSGDRTGALELFGKLATLSPKTEVARLANDLGAQWELVVTVVYADPKTQCFHRPYCPACSPTLRGHIFCKSAQEAVDAGYDPCTFCGSDPGGIYEKLSRKIATQRRRHGRAMKSALESMILHGASKEEATARRQAHEQLMRRAAEELQFDLIFVPLPGGRTGVMAPNKERALQDLLAHARSAQQYAEQQKKQETLLAFATESYYVSQRRLLELEWRLDESQRRNNAAIILKQSERCYQSQEWPQVVSFARLVATLQRDNERWPELLGTGILKWCEEALDRCSEIIASRRFDGAVLASSAELVAATPGGEDLKSRTEAFMLRLREIDPAAMLAWEDLRDAYEEATGILKDEEAIDILKDSPFLSGQAVAVLSRLVDDMRAMNTKFAAWAEDLARRTIAAEEAAKER